MINDPLGGFRDDLLASGRHRPRQPRRGLLIGAGVAALLAVVTAGVVWAGSDGGDERDAVVVADDPTTTSEAAAPSPTGRGGLPAGPVWSIAQPPGWGRVDEGGALQLTYGVGGPDIGGDCTAEYSGDRVHVFIGFPETTELLPPRPAVFDDDSVPLTEAGDCMSDGDTEVRGGRWWESGSAVDVLVVFGPDVTPAMRELTWATVSSLRPEHGGEGAPVCVATRATEPGIEVPADWPDRPSSGVWWGTPELWTALPTDGSYPSRKSVWWSENFPGGAEEESPDIIVDWQRLDEVRPAIDNDGYGTNAHTPEDGWFIIAGGDPPGAGCWEVSAEYKGASLSYVYWLAPTLWTAPPQNGTEDALIEGDVAYNPDHSCVLVGTRPVVWPAGTTIAENGSIELADGRQIHVGDHLTAGGAYGPPERFGEHTIPEICVPEDGEIAVIGEVSDISD